MKKLVAILMVLALVFAFAACGAKTSDETTTTEATVEDTSAEVDTTEAGSETASESETETESAAAPEESTEAVTEATTAAPASDTTKATEAESESATEAPKAPQTKEEIVAYFNTSVNKIKTDAKSVTRKYSKITLNGSMTLPSAINGVLRLLGGADEFVGGQLEKNSKTEPETFNGKAAIKGAYPVENETWSSKLTAADVQSATCTESNGKYTIVIKTVADSKSENVSHGQGHAPKAFNVPLPGTINENIPGVATGIVGTAAMSYPSSTAKIVVDAKTGNVISADYDTCWTINFDKAGVIIPFVTHDSYTVKF